MLGIRVGIHLHQIAVRFLQQMERNEGEKVVSNVIAVVVRVEHDVREERIGVGAGIAHDGLGPLPDMVCQFCEDLDEMVDGDFRAKPQANEANGE